jgi:hypothetical protein
MKRTVVGHDVDKSIPGDVSVVGIRWVNDEKDVLIELAFPGSHDAPPDGELMCKGATDVQIDIDWSGYIGSHPTWDVEVSQLANGRWRVEFDIRPGLISLFCNELSLSLKDESAD